MNDIDTIECLRKAKELCAGSWGQGYMAVMTPGVSCFCIATAIAQVNSGFHGPAHVMIAKANAIEPIHSEYYEDIEEAYSDGVIKWNDEPGRTQQEVLAAFDKAIVLAGAKAS